MKSANEGEALTGGMMDQDEMSSPNRDLLLFTKENPLALLGPAFLRFVRKRLRGKQAL